MRSSEVGWWICTVLDKHSVQLKHRRVDIEIVVEDLENAYDYHLHDNYSSWMLLALTSEIVV